jgi:hypothetical protein
MRLRAVHGSQLAWLTKGRGEAGMDRASDAMDFSRHRKQASLNDKPVIRISSRGASALLSAGILGNV